MRKLVFIILAFLPILLIVTIGIASKVYSQRTYIYVESVVFTDEFENEYPSDKIIRLSPGSTYQLYYKIYPELATNQKVTFYSDNTDLCTVNNKGEIVVAEDNYGVCYITLQTECGNKTIRILINVAETKVTSIKLPAELNLKVGAQFDLDVEIYPLTATNKKIHWESSDNSVCQVDVNGRVKAVGAGIATITATSDDDESIKATTTVVVTESADIIFKNPDGIYEIENNTFDLTDMIEYLNPESEALIEYQIISGKQHASIEGDILTINTTDVMINVQITVRIGDDTYSPTYTVIFRNKN